MYLISSSTSAPKCGVQFEGGYYLGAGTSNLGRHGGISPMQEDRSRAAR